jgi:ATP-dependent Clp protease ATP-binding subunit ClpA
VVLFKPLTVEEIGRIVDLQLDELRKRLKERDLGLRLTPRAKELLVERGYDPVYGARPLKRLIQREVETPVARKIVSGEVTDGGSVEVDARDGEFVIVASRGASG